LTEDARYGKVEEVRHNKGRTVMQQSSTSPFEFPTNFSTKIDKSGRVVIPSALRDRLHLSPGDELVVEERAGVVTLSTYDRILADAQEYFCSLVPPGVSLVDELLAERRAEFEREQAEEADDDE
jgi:AbrB family looped-hinge helix DNA binding protein